MSIKSISIAGLRGYSKKTTINFAIPDKNNIGSGLNILVGPNNSGKSTLIEAVHLLSRNKDTIPVTSRNKMADEKISIEATDELGNIITLRTTENGGAFVQRKWNDEVIEYSNNELNTFILSNKRNFSSTFSNNSHQSRESYNGNIGNEEFRKDNYYNNNFGGRLLDIYNNKKKIFNDCLGKVLNPLPQWTIDSQNGDNLYLEFSFDGIRHGSQGAGDGFINIFNIVDALYDSSENNVILIDEPEISLHPDLQRKLFDLLLEYSKDKQIIISTHSPYFINWNVLSKIGKIFRFKKENNIINVYELSESTKEKIIGILKDSNNPHILSLDANEVFFLNDNVILVEGQEDVICYKRIFEKNIFEPNASFFGWGAGGALKVEGILDMLNDLGYSKVFTILDNDKRECMEDLQKKFENYGFYAIAANDVRNKENETIKKLKKELRKNGIDLDENENIASIINSFDKDIIGLVKDKKKFEINQEFEEDVDNLIKSIKEYFIQPVITSADEDEKQDIFDEKVEKSIAEKYLMEYMKKNKPFDEIKNRYNHIEFNAGGGHLLSIKRIDENVFYAIFENSLHLTDKYFIIVDYHFNIDIKDKKVILKNKKIVSDTLPKKEK